MPFLKVIAQSEIQTASPGIWTQVTDSISKDDNCDAKCAPFVHLPTEYRAGYDIKSIF